jgi:hypothetical protein
MMPTRVPGSRRDDTGPKLLNETNTILGENIANQDALKRYEAPPKKSC